jgi:ATP-binding cassette subfamily B protein
MLVVAGILSSVAGATEVVSALILGWVIDATVNSGPADFFAGHGGLIAGFLVFYMVVRPLVFGLTSASNAIIVGRT